MAKLIKTDGSVTDVKPADGRAFTLEELQKFVGGYIEIINVGERAMVMDEEGKLKRKAVNECATERMSGYICADDEIVGDVLLCDTGELS